MPEAEARFGLCGAAIGAAGLSERLTFELVDMLLNCKFHYLLRVMALPLVLICCLTSACTLFGFFSNG